MIVFFFWLSIVLSLLEVPFGYLLYSLCRKYRGLQTWASERRVVEQLGSFTVVLSTPSIDHSTANRYIGERSSIS